MTAEGGRKNLRGRCTLKRVLAGLFLFALVVFVDLYTSKIWVLLLVLVVSALALWEYTRSVTGERGRAGIAWGFAVALPVVPLFAFYPDEARLFLPAYLVGAAFVLILSRFTDEEHFSEALSWTWARVGGIIYIALPLAHVVLLWDTEMGPWWLLFVVGIVYGNDTFAFCTGRLVGRTKLCPTISPKKTVEGAVGGLIGGFGFAWAFNDGFGLGLSTAEVAAAALILGATSILGDLVESVLKRGAGIKDSGAVIPCHGGMLDRIDSLIFTVPAAYYLLLIR